MPRPSHCGHIPPVRVNELTCFCCRPRATVIEPRAVTDGVLNENAGGGPMWGCPKRENRIRSTAWASVAVPTVERGFEPMRSWSTTIAAVSPSRTSTSGRAVEGMKPCTKEQ